MFSMCFLGANLDFLGRDYFGSEGHYFNKPVLHTIFQASEPSGYEERDFLIYFYKHVFLLFKPSTKCGRVI